MDNKKKYLLGVGVLLVALITIGISYAYWMLAFKQSGSNLVSSDCFKITFTGENDINLTNAYPMGEEELQKFYDTAVPYHFTISNVCESAVHASVNLETLSVAGKKLNDEYIDAILYDGTKSYNEITVPYVKDKLTNISLNNENKVIPDSLNAYLLYDFMLSGNSSKEFNLLLHMDSDTPPIEEVMNASFESKITISASYSAFEPIKNTILSKDSLLNTTFSKYHLTYATTLVFQNKLQPIEGAITSFDESINQTNTVRSYVLENPADANYDETTYTIYIQANGKILLPEDSSSFFANFSSLKKVIGLENLDTSQVTNMSYMFSETDVSIFDFNFLNMDHVQNVSYMFSGSTGLSNLDLSQLDTSQITDMSYMFANCTELNNLDFSKLDTSHVTNMSYMFSGSSGLDSLNFSNLDTSHVTNMSGMFSSSGFTGSGLSDFDTSNVTDMSSMFSRCSNLTSLNLSSFDTSKVTNMSNMFYFSQNLENLDVSNFDTSRVTDMSGMFGEMFDFAGTLDLSNFDTSNVTNMSGMFDRMANLPVLDVSNFDTSKVTDMSNMFSGMWQLTSLNITGFDTSNVTNMFRMFYQSYRLTAVDVSSFDTSNVTNMREMFSGMFGEIFYFTGTLDLSSFDTSNVTDMYGMFAGADLSTITYGPNFVRKSGSDITDMYRACSANKPTDASWDGAF